MLVDGTIASADLASNSVTGSHIVNLTRVLSPNLMGEINSNFGIRTMPTGFTEALYTIAIPYDYAGGDLLFRESFRWGDNPGSARFDTSVNKVTVTGETIHIFFNSADLPCPADNGFPYRTWALPASLIQPGEVLFVALQRQGDHPNDTAGRLDLMTVAMEYSADQ